MRHHGVQLAVVGAMSGSKRSQPALPPRDSGRAAAEAMLAPLRCRSSLGACRGAARPASCGTVSQCTRQRACAFSTKQVFQHAEYRERILLTNAVGLMQGWAWSEAVDGWVVQGVGAIGAYGVRAHVLGGLAAAASLSVLLVGMRLCITRTHRRRVLDRMQRGGQRAWLMRQPLESPAQGVISALRQRSASAERSQGRDDLL